MDKVMIELRGGKCFDFRLSDSQRRGLLLVLNPPSWGKVAELHRRWRELAGRGGLSGLLPVPREDWEDLIDRFRVVDLEVVRAVMTLYVVECAASEYLARLSGIDDDKPDAAVRDSIQEASKHLRRALKAIRHGGSAGRCAVTIHARRRKLMDYGELNVFLDRLECFALALDDAVGGSYANLSKDNRSRGLKRDARVRLVSRMWAEYCKQYRVPLEKTTDQRFNRLIATVFGMIDRDCPTDLRRLINAGRKAARETGSGN